MLAEFRNEKVDRSCVGVAEVFTGSQERALERCRFSFGEGEEWEGKGWVGVGPAALGAVVGERRIEAPCQVVAVGVGSPA